MQALDLLPKSCQNKTVAIRLTLTIFLVPKKTNEFGPFSFKFFVPIRVGLRARLSLRIRLLLISRMISCLTFLLFVKR